MVLQKLKKIYNEYDFILLAVICVIVTPFAFKELGFSENFMPFTVIILASTSFLSLLYIFIVMTETISIHNEDKLND